MLGNAPQTRRTGNAASPFGAKAGLRTSAIQGEQPDVKKLEEQWIAVKRMPFRRREPRFIALPAGSYRIFDCDHVEKRRGELTLGNVAAVLIITCVVEVWSSCSRFSDSRPDLVRRAQEQRAVIDGKPVLPPCPSAPYPVLKVSTPGVGHHRVFLSWHASSSSNGSGAADVGYCLYRSQRKGAANKSATCPDCEPVTLVPVLGTRCVDNVVRDQTVYYYVAITISVTGRTSSPTSETVAQIPVAERQNAAPPDAAAYPACRAPASSPTLR